MKCDHLFAWVGLSQLGNDISQKKPTQFWTLAVSISDKNFADLLEIETVLLEIEIESEHESQFQAVQSRF